MSHLLTLMSKRFTPASIAGLVLWLDASRITGLVDGDPVPTWIDLSGNGNSPTQGTAAQRPTYKTNIQNGRPVVRGDGVDDRLIVTLNAASSAWTFFFVGKRAGGSPTTQRYWGLGSTNAIINLFDTGSQFSFFQTEGNAAAALGGTPTVFSIVTYVMSSNASMTAYVNSGAGTTVDPKDFSTQTALALFGSTSGDFINADCGEFIGYNVALTTAQRLQVEAYLRVKWATP